MPTSSRDLVTGCLIVLLFTELDITMKASETELLNVPNFVFYQKDNEQAIQVNYYNGSIEFKQGNDKILIEPDQLDEFFKAVKKHRPEAEELLDKR